MADIKYIQDGKRATLEDAQKAPVIVAGTEDNLVQLFASQAAFRAWADKSEYAEKFAEIQQLITRVKKYKNADNTAAIKLQQSRTRRITKELMELSRSTGLSLNSEELFKKAAVDYHPIEGPIFDPAILYQHINLGGRFLPLTNGVGYPDFTWLGFNDIASSVSRVGWCILWEHAWYSGRQLFLAAPQLGQKVGANLTTFGFNDIASSAIIH
jgi:hypothetical protein